MRRHLLALLLVPVLALLWFAGSGKALAHDELVSTTPTKGASLATAPTQVTLTFSDTVRTTGTAVVVKSSNGEQVQQGTPTVAGETITQPLKPGLPAGAFQVVWRAASSDGHPVSGNFAFSVSGGASSAAPSNSVVPPATSSATASGGNTVSGSASTSPSTSYLSPVPTSQTPTDSTNNQPWLIAGGVVIALLVIGGVVAVIRTRARDDNADL